MKKIYSIGIFAGGLIIGVIAGSWWAWHVYSGQVGPKQVDMACQTALNAEVLAMLRLNEPKSAISELEHNMGLAIHTLAQWNEVRPLDEKSRKARDRWLVGAKVYHESYPLRDMNGNDAAFINSFLARIPGRNPKSICKSSICRLDDMRRAGLNADTNSAPTKAKPDGVIAPASAAQFTVTSNGTTPLSYQWRVGTNAPSATNR